MTYPSSNNLKLRFIHPIRSGFGYAFLIEKPNGLYLIDSGSPGNESLILSKMSEIRRYDLRLIWITHAHYDHYGSAAMLREITGAPIGTHFADKDYLANGKSPLGTSRRYGFIYRYLQMIIQNIYPLPPTQPDLTLSDNDVLNSYGLEARILHTPGHTPGHSCLELNPHIVFTGDLLGNFPKLALQNLLAVNWDQLQSSLQKMISIKPKCLFTGHSPNPILGRRLHKFIYMKIFKHFRIYKC